MEKCLKECGRGEKYVRKMSEKTPVLPHFYRSSVRVLRDGKTFPNSFAQNLQRGETLTYGTRESLTYGTHETLTPFGAPRVDKTETGRCRCRHLPVSLSGLLLLCVQFLQECLGFGCEVLGVLVRQEKDIG